VNFSDVVPAYAGLFFGIATSISSLSAVIGNIIAGILIKHPTLHDWRKLFLLFFVVYLIGGIVYLVLGSAVPEKWATLKSLEKDAHSPEETMPMKELQGLDQSKDIENEQTRNVQA
jgi:MFS family permease